jgi:hypothetical protein
METHFDAQNYRSEIELCSAVLPDRKRPGIGNAPATGFYTRLHFGFADRDLTTWLPRREFRSAKYPNLPR